MARVNLQDHVLNASVPPSSTPTSSSTPANGSTSTGAARSYETTGISADTPIPSVEQEQSSIRGITHSASAGARLRSPSISLTPPESASSTSGSPFATPGPSSRAGRSESDIGSINSQLRGTKLSSPIRMTEIVNAIDDVARGVNGRERSLLTPEPSEGASMSSTPKRSPHRRRSSSRVNEPMHDVSDEHAPNDRFSEAGFQTLFQKAKTSMAKLAGALGSNGRRYEPDSIMQYLYGRANNLAGFQCPSTRIVGFVGDSGVGKSRLLNSLLDKRGLARVSNSGSACTCVVTEYHHHEGDDFKVEINYFTTKEILDQVRSLLQSYRHYHLHKDDFTGDDIGNIQDIEKIAEVAKDTFRSMFGTRLQSEKLLLVPSNDHVLAFLENLVHKCQPADRGQTEVRSGLSECSELIGQLTSQASEQASTSEPAAWPYIRNIKVYSNAHILSKGLVLVDLPGLHDANSARRHITERYMRNCDEIFAICPRGRAITDAGVVSVLELARKARLANVGIVCTRSDDIDAEEEKKDLKGDRATKIDMKLHTVESIREKIREIKDDLAGLDELDPYDLTVEEKEELTKLGRDLRITEDELKQHKFELDRLLITTRNEIVKRELLNKYRKEVPGGRLHVHCVSNTIYSEHREGARSKSMPYLRLSGILEIREHCMSMVSESRYLAALHYMQNDIPALLGDVKLWVQSGSGSMSAERKVKITETLNVVESRLKQGLSGNASGVKGLTILAKKEFSDKIYNPSRQRILVWGRSANEASADWSSWHHSSYSAFCSNRGSHVTAKIGRRDWNGEIIESMVEDLTPLWLDLLSSLEDECDNSRNLAVELLDWAVEYLDTELDDETEIAEVLGQTLIYRQQLLEKDMEEASGVFLKVLNSVRTDALTGIRTSFIGNVMEDPYRKASRSGSHNRRKAIINGAVQNRQLFKDLLNEFKRAFDSQAEILQSNMQHVTKSHLESIQLTLGLVRNDNVVLESEKDPEFRARVEMEVSVAGDEMEAIKEKLFT